MICQQLKANNKALSIEFKLTLYHNHKRMGPSQSANYTSTLHFVQNLDDENFGQVQIYRNDEGKFIMKCAKSFLTGDKRHSDFKQVLDFIRQTSNKNVLPLFHLEQYHQSNVCIEYEKVFIYTEYLNFTLKGLIINKKNIDEQEMWYLLKSMVELMIELQKNNMKLFFSLDNIFLTLKGIPSVFLYHLICNQKPFMINEIPFNPGHSGSTNNDLDQNASQLTENNDQNGFQNDSIQIDFRPESMSYSLGKTVIQLFNMKLLETQQDQQEEETLKQQLFMVNKKNPFLGKVIKLLLTSSNPSEILNQLQLMEKSKQINISSEIRFNKFRYVVAGEQKNQLAVKDFSLKDLNLNDKHLNDFKSRPLSAANTPIYRLRETQPRQMGSRELSVRNKVMKSEQNFFKNKKPKEQQTVAPKQYQYQQSEGQKQKQQILQTKLLNENQKSVQKYVTEDPQRRKANSISLCQTNLNRYSGVGRNSKLSLISKRNLSTSKIQISHSVSRTKQPSEGGNQSDDLKPSDSNHRHKLHVAQQQNLDQHQELKLTEGASNKVTLRASNRIKEILNEELSKSRQLYKNYAYKLGNNQKSTLLSKNSKDTSHIQSKATINGNNRTNSKKSFFKPEKYKSSTSKPQGSNPQKAKPQLQSLNNKTEHHEQEEKSIMYKPFITEQDQYEDNLQIKNQTIKALFGLSEQKSLTLQSNSVSQQKLKNTKEKTQSMESSVFMNGLDKSNFLSTLEMKKSINNMKVKNILQKKDLILCNLQKNNTFHQNVSQLSCSHQKKNDPKACIRNYFSQKESQTPTVKNPVDPTDRTVGLIEICMNEMKEDRSGFKKKVKLRSDKNEQLQAEGLYKNQLIDLVKNKQNSRMNKQNNPSNMQDKLVNSKLRKLSLRSKPERQ